MVKNNVQHDLVIALKNSGKSYKEIAEILGVKTTYCRTVCSRAKRKAKATEKSVSSGQCSFCGKPLTMVLGAKPKHFCNDTCRSRFHNRKKAEHKNIAKCEICEKLFVSYGPYISRFCSSECRQKGAIRKNAGR